MTITIPESITFSRSEVSTEFRPIYWWRVQSIQCLRNLFSRQRTSRLVSTMANYFDHIYRESFFLWTLYRLQHTFVLRSMGRTSSCTAHNCECTRPNSPCHQLNLQSSERRSISIQLKESNHHNIQHNAQPKKNWNKKKEKTKRIITILLTNRRTTMSHCNQQCHTDGDEHNHFSIHLTVFDRVKSAKKFNQVSQREK